MPIINLNQGTADALLQNWFPVGAASRPRFVVVVDVGQGNCNVVFNDNWRPFIYYDLGGGMSGSQFTYPHPAPTYCIDVAYSRVIQSHWDEDHYRAMLQLSNAHAINNIHILAPAQDRSNIAWRASIQKSMSAEALEQTLDGDGCTLHKWPDEDWHNAPVMRRSTHSHFRVIKCSGNDTNNSGLALRIENPGVAGEYMLLTGDATFEQLPHMANQQVFRHGVDQRCVGLVAGHHGSPVGHTPYVPRPNRAAEYLIVYSFGWGNAFGHPNIGDGVTAYESREWDDDHRMDTGGAEFAAKYAGPRGNVGLLWPGAARGPCYADAANTPEEINGAAVSLLATAAAEIDVYQNVLGTRAQVAVGAAYQAAIESKIPLVANAMLVPAVQVPPRTLAQRAADMAGLAATHASLAGALGTVVATAAVASHVNAQALAAAIVDCVMLAAAKCAQEVTNFVEIVIADLLSDPLNVPTLPSQAKEAAAQAHGCAAHADTIEVVHDAIPTEFATRIVFAAHARNGANVPTDAQIKTAVTAAVCAASQARIGQPGGNFSQGPAEAAATAVAAMAAIRADVRVAIAAAAALAPAIPINPRAFAPAMLIDNVNAKLLPRIAAVAAICGTPSLTLAEVARAAVASARVAFAGACGAPQVGCHRHPRVCPNGPCSLSIHNFFGMFPASVSTFAGTGVNGNVGDAGQAAAAQFNTPTHLEYDADWNVYVSDPGHHRVRVIDASGDIRALAGDGNQGYAGDSNALATNARLRTPAGLAMDASRNRLFIADSVSHRVREVNLSTGIITTIAGTGAPGFGGDRGLATAALLNAPSGLALAVADNLLYIADTGNNRIRCVNLTTGKIRTFAGTGVAGHAGDDGPPAAATLSAPTAVAVDAGGGLYIADTGNHCVRLVSAGLITAFAGDGTQGFWGDGADADSAHLNAPGGVAVDSTGNVYIADRGNRRVRKVNEADGTISTFAGTGANGNGGDGGLATAATFNTVCGVAVDSTDDVYIVDRGHHRVRKVTVADGTIDEFAGNGTQGFDGDDFDARGAELDTPLAVACGREDVFIADSVNHRVRRVDGAVDIYTCAGDGNNGHAGDANHPAAAARLDTPGGLSYDRDNHVLYVADSGNHRVRRVDLRSRNISLVAGNGTQGFGGDNGDALLAQLDTPSDVAYDFKGDVLYICDQGNNCIRALSVATGAITTFAGDGNAAFAGDGGAPAAASLHTPVAVAVDNSRNVYVATVGDHRVRLIAYDDTTDTFTMNTLAGTGVQGHTGDGAAANAAQIDTPQGLAVDGAGVVYIACTPQARVRKVEEGIITTLVGTGAAGFAGDGGLPGAAQMNGPRGLAVDQAGRSLFIADTGNRRIRRAIL
ncbi:NHL domain-containing protein [Myxococcus sp. NMCA1]|uniref:NHL domain-containing protein n=1 Tax=Myxococcus sp. NMCA1 TaxID=2996785 RepID=UPI002285F88B|nr:hypothetical protein [Myxococcus sp. NMCA1]WAM25338.1 hypothetical protein OZ403_33205 [Myxococcus sp. NMCA1]